MSRPKKWLLYDPLLPHSRIAMLMENRYHINRVAADVEVDRVGESVKQRPANVFSDAWKLQWRLGDVLQDCIKFDEKFSPEACMLVFVPSHGIQDIEISIIP